MAKTIKLCVIAPDKDAYSETFIHAHVRELVPGAEFLYGDGSSFPTKRADGTTLLSGSFISRFLREFLKKILHLPDGYYEKKSLKRFLTEKRIDAVLAEYGPTGAAVVDSCHELRIPLTVCFHGYDAYTYDLLKTMRVEYENLFKKASAVVAVSRPMERHLLGLGAVRERLFSNACGADTVYFKGADPAAAPAHFLAVGRFVDKKAPILTVLAFKKVHEACPEARLTMVGDGPLKEATFQLITTLGLSDCIHLAGVRKPAEILELIKSSRAFVQHSLFTSYGDSEGLPVGILEASAAGLPVVSTIHAGIPDAVEDQVTGFLVAERDVDGMADRMIRLAKDPFLAKTMGQAGSKKISTAFSREISIGGLRKIIQNTVH